MSQLIQTVQYVRLGRSPFRAKPKDVPVFAQLLVGGAGLWIVKGEQTGRGAIDHGQGLRISTQGPGDLATLQALFALAADLPPSDETAFASDLREDALADDCELSRGDEMRLAQTVADLAVHVHVSTFSSELTNVTGRDGWSVSTSRVDI